MRYMIVAAALLIGANVGSAQFFGNDAAARVNGETISLTELKNVMDQRATATTLPKDQEMAMRRAALDLPIDDLLMRQFLRKSVQTPPAGQIDQRVDDLREALKRQNKTLDQFLRDEKLTEQRLRDDIVAELQWKVYLNNQFREDKARDYFETNRPYFEKVHVTASHILITIQNPSERENLRGRFEDLRRRILARELPFEEFAKKHSDCPSKERGGDIGSFAYKFDVSDSFARAAFNTRVGDISPIFETEHGLHIVKVTHRTSPDPAQFDAMKDFVRKTMAQDLNLYRSLLADQRRSAQIENLLK